MAPCDIIANINHRPVIPRHLCSILQNHPRPVRLILARLLEHCGLSALFKIKLDGYQLRFYPTNSSANLWIDPRSRIHGLALFRDYCKEGDVAVDVGANIGETSIILSQCIGTAGKVFAFEPHPRIYRYLLGNLALNHCANVTTRNLALGAASTSARMSDDKRDDMNRMMKNGTIAIACSTLDAEIPSDGQVDFLKVDVEGSELRVLQGGSATIARTQCINCEMGEEHCRRYGHGMSDLIAFLQGEGFDTFVIVEDRKLRAVDSSFHERGGHELVAAKDVDAFVRRTGWKVC